jgi:hypothetical protein
MALRQEGNFPLQLRRCREAKKNESGGRNGQTYSLSLAEVASIIYTFPLLIDISGKQEQSVKCQNGHSNPTAATVPKRMDFGSE